MKELAGLFRLHYDRLIPVFQITNRFAAIIRKVCDISMFVLEIIYESFVKRWYLELPK